MLKIKYNGRAYSSQSSLQNALRRDLERNVDQQIRRAANSTNVRVRKTHKGYELEGSPENMRRLQNRLGR